MERHDGMILTMKNRIIQRKTCPSATLSTTSPVWADPGKKLSLQGEGPATNLLSYGRANNCLKRYRCPQTMLYFGRYFGEGGGKVFETKVLSQQRPLNFYFITWVMQLLPNSPTFHLVLLRV
jgi:hypothetical protein